MNQGMVAFVNGKFTNASAHTSYLILLKNLRLPELAFANPFRRRSPSFQIARKRFASCYRPHPNTNKTAVQPFRFTAPEDSFSESPPC